MKHARVTILCPERPSIQGPGLEQQLRRCLGELGLAIEEVSPPTGTRFAYRTGSLMLAVSTSAGKLPEADFETALASPLSRPHAEMLRREIARHEASIRIAVNRLPRRGVPGGAEGNGATPAPALSDWKEMLRLLHAVTSCLVRRHGASVVHWQQSDQLIAADRYGDLAAQEIPWPLIARARFGADGQRMELEGARALIGRRIRVVGQDRPAEEMHAAALALMRQILRMGYLPEGGETLSLAGGARFALAPPRPGNDLLLLEALPVCRGAPDPEPPAMPESRAFRAGGGDGAEAGAAAAGAGMARAVASMMERADLGDPFRSRIAPRRATPAEQRERTRSLALSYLMLVVMPPIGALLMLSNAIFSASTWRTSLAATAALAMAMLLGGYTFLSVAAESGIRLSSQAPARIETISRQAIN